MICRAASKRDTQSAPKPEVHASISFAPSARQESALQGEVSRREEPKILFLCRCVPRHRSTQQVVMIATWAKAATPEVAAVRLWVERVVIGLALCPWARPVHTERSALRFAQTGATGTEGLLCSTLQEMDLLSFPDSRHESTMLVAPLAFTDDFIAFNDFVNDVEDMLRDERRDEEFQLIGFHPQFLFADADEDDAANYVNRSPHPVLHLLRQDDVTAAVDAHPDSLSISSVNQKLLRSMGGSRLKQLVSAARSDGCKEARRASDSAASNGGGCPLHVST